MGYTVRSSLRAEMFDVSVNGIQVWFNTEFFNLKKED